MSGRKEEEEEEDVAAEKEVQAKVGDRAVVMVLGEWGTYGRNMARMLSQVAALCDAPYVGTVHAPRAIVHAVRQHVGEAGIPRLHILAAYTSMPVTAETSSLETKHVTPVRLADVTMAAMCSLLREWRPKIVVFGRLAAPSAKIVFAALRECSPRVHVIMQPSNPSEHRTVFKCSSSTFSLPLFASTAELRSAEGTDVWPSTTKLRVSGLLRPLGHDGVEEGVVEVACSALQQAGQHGAELNVTCVPADDVLLLMEEAECHAYIARVVLRVLHDPSGLLPLPPKPMRVLATHFMAAVADATGFRVRVAAASSGDSTRGAQQVAVVLHRLTHRSAHAELVRQWTAEAHPEGGFWRLNYRAAHITGVVPHLARRGCDDSAVPAPTRREVASSILYTLTESSPRGFLHCVTTSDILHVWHGGDPLLYFILVPPAVVHELLPRIVTAHGPVTHFESRAQPPPFALLVQSLRSDSSPPPAWVIVELSARNPTLVVPLRCWKASFLTSCTAPLPQHGVSHAVLPTAPGISGYTGRPTQAESRPPGCVRVADVLPAGFHMPRCAHSAGFGTVVEVVAPAFDFDGWRMGGTAHLVSQFPECEPFVRLFTRHDAAETTYTPTAEEVAAVATHKPTATAAAVATNKPTGTVAAVATHKPTATAAAVAIAKPTVDDVPVKPTAAAAPTTTPIAE